MSPLGLYANSKHFLKNFQSLFLLIPTLHYIYLINSVNSYFSDSDYSVFFRLLIVRYYQSDIVLGRT